MKTRLNLTLSNGRTLATGKWLGGIFAVATILSSFGTGSLPQINNIAGSVYSTFEIDHMVTGGVLAVILGLVILGGIKRIVQVTEKLVPGMAIIYFLGAMAVIFSNLDNIVPSFISIFADVFTGSAMGGGFLGATFAFAFNKGVGRGLFSNEAGQGSAPIAHAAAKAHEPVSEGMVAILEPFIDTIIICTLTGLVLLSSGSWQEKYDNDFQYSDLEILEGVYEETNPTQKDAVSGHLLNRKKLAGFDGTLQIESGIVQNPVTIIHARSFAENVTIYKGKQPFTGSVEVNKGKLGDDAGVRVRGKSLVHSAPLTTQAFKKSFLGDSGKYIVTIGLLLFAFSTAISWSYYGDRAMTYLFGSKSIIIFRIVYVIGFFLASFADTTIIWTLSGITIALMTIPNLVGLLLLRKEMKETVGSYWAGFKSEFPNEKTPE